MRRESGKLGSAPVGRGKLLAGGPGHRYLASLVSLAENTSLHSLSQYHDSGCLGPTLAA